MGDEGNGEAMPQILQSVEKARRMVGGLSLVPFLLDQIEEIPENRSEYIELLRQMFKLVGYIRRMRYDMPQEENILNGAIILIVEGSMICASQIKSTTIFRFLKGFVNHEGLSTIKLKINQLHQDLTLRALIEIQQISSLLLSLHGSLLIQIMQLASRSRRNN
ncbi:hypothetical protein SUGI_0700380 [Cryptomeria japonica]|nr:hypothetical protein SUGI_0700380 [Cryptomeria japonica]